MGLRFVLWFLVVGLTPIGVDASIDYWQQVTPLSVGSSVFQINSSRKQNLAVAAHLGVQSSSYFGRITWAQVESSLHPEGRAQIETYRSRNKLNYNATVARYDYEVTSQVYQLAPGWGYGFSSNWSFGFRVPIRITKYSVHSKLEVEDSALDVMSKSQGVSVLEYRERLILMAKSIQAETTQQINSRDGDVEMGDIEILNKVLLPSVGPIDWALLGTVRFPAALNHSPYDGLFVQDDSGQFDIGLCANWIIRTDSRWQFSGSVGYLSQLADRQNISWKEGEKSHSEVLHDVRRDLGDIGFANLNSEYRVSERLKVLVGYRVEKKGADEFELEDRDQPWTFEHESRQSGQFGVSYLFNQDAVAANLHPLQSTAHIQVAKIFSGDGFEEDPFTEIFLEWYY